MTQCVLLLALTVMSSIVPMFRAAELRPFSPFKTLHLQVQRANVTKNVHSVKYERGCACGKANKVASSGEDSDDDDGKIVGGTDAGENEFPWQTVVYSPTTGGFCGGTIINKRFV